jgi:hypothetical protein
MQQPNWNLADAIALELVNRETDVNEVQKVASHLRVYAESRPDQVGQRFFTLLETMVRDGRFLVRSGRTLDYYRDLRDVCTQHLSDFRTTTPEKGWELVGILGWAARLMRYYKAEEGTTELAGRARHRSEGRSSHAGEELALPKRRQSQPTPQMPSPQPSKPAPRLASKPTPVRVETTRESVTLVTAGKGGKARVRTSRNEEVNCTGIPIYPPANVGEACRADVTREGGRAVKAFFKGWV